MKKIITLLLAVIMLAAVFASCNNDPQVTTPAPNEQTPAPTDPEDKPTETPETNYIGDEVTVENQKLNLDLESIDYGGEDVFFYTWNAWNPEFEVDEDAAEGDPINEAIYKRNLFVEEELGIALNFYGVDGWDGKQQAWIDALRIRVDDPETPVDIVAAYSRGAPFVLINGFATDLETYAEDLDLTKIWWPSLVKDEHMIRGRLFYVTGDISTGLLLEMHGLFMNKGMFKSLGNDYDAFMKDIISDPKKSTWTLDKMIEICVPAYNDNDGIEGKSAGDTFGLIGNQVYAIDAFWQTTGYKLFKYSDADGVVYTISDELAGEQTTNFVTKMTEWNNTNPCYIATEASYIWDEEKSNTHFGANNSLFLATRFVYFEAASMDIDYAVVPFPKYEDDQERFYTCVGNPYSLYSISPSSKDLTRAAQVIQAMGYKGYLETTPAIFDTVFKGQYSKDDYSIDACNIVRSAITFDVGRTYDRITETMLPNAVSGPIVTNQKWIFNNVAAKAYNRKIENVNKQILKALESIQ